MDKIRLSILFGSLLFSTLCFGQSRQLTDDDYNTSGAIKLIFANTSDSAKELAAFDIKNKIPFLFIQSGYSPKVYDSDSIFEKTYNVYYYEQGCTGPDNNLMIVYNHVIFDHLFSKYGKKWKRTIRKDVIGLKKWKIKN